MIDVPSIYYYWFRFAAFLLVCQEREEVKKFQMTEEMLAFGRFPNN